MSLAAGARNRPLVYLATAWAAGSYAGCAGWLAPEQALVLAFALLATLGLAGAPRLRAAGLLAALALAAGVRASASDPGGCWSVRELHEGAELASTGRAEPQVELAAGAVEEGARVALAARPLLRLAARGPVPDPSGGSAGRLVRELAPGMKAKANAKVITVRMRASFERATVV